MKKEDKKTVVCRAIFTGIIILTIFTGISGCVKSTEPINTEIIPAWRETETDKEKEIHIETTEPTGIEIVESTEITETIEIVEEPTTEEDEQESVIKELMFKELVILASQIPKPTLQLSGGENTKMIALTFDDGPSQYTEQILDILTQNGGTATFFVVGYKISSYQQTIKNVAAQGSEVAGHSWNHPQFTKISDEKIREELDSTNSAIFNLTGIYPRIYRVPYGSINDNVKNVSKALGLAIIQWNIDPRDWSVKNADTVYDNIMSSVKDGGIVVLHDTHETTLEAMKRVIPELSEAGYKFVTVSELLQEMYPGVVYYGK